MKKLAWKKNRQVSVPEKIVGNTDSEFITP